MRKLRNKRFIAIMYIVNIIAFSHLVGVAMQMLNTIELIGVLISSAILFGSIFGMLFSIINKLNSLENEKKNKAD